MQEEIEEGYKDFAERWNPILDVFEVHPTEIAYDFYTAERALEAFGFNFDPSHFYRPFGDPVKLIERFPDRIYHVRMKDAARLLDGESGILSSHLEWGIAAAAGTSARWGGVDFQAISGL